MYMAATRLPGRTELGIYINNLWFLLLTGVIMVVGSELQSRLRFRDFAANEALRRSRRALELSYERLRELDELKGRFFANISHELRTPLTLLLAPIESLLRQSAGKESRWREPLETMRDNSMRLLKLINDLLDLVRLDAGRLKLNCSTIECRRSCAAWCWPSTAWPRSADSG
jgi:signal transduction histidine kinase